MTPCCTHMHNPTESTRETGVLQAYFTAGAVKGIATACHDQKIKDCPCNFDGPAESRDEENNLIYRVCREDFAFALNYILNFIFHNLRVSIDTVRSVITIVIPSNIEDSLLIEEIPKTTSTDVPAPTTTEAPGSPEQTRVLADIHNTLLGFRVRRLWLENQLCVNCTVCVGGWVVAANIIHRTIHIDRDILTAHFCFPLFV